MTTMKVKLLRLQTELKSTHLGPRQKRVLQMAIDHLKQKNDKE